MNALEVVKAAIPNADKVLAEAILWGRTPFPVGAVSVRDLYEAASRYRRASDHGIALCDWCDRLAVIDGCLCEGCAAALDRGNHESDDAL